MKEYKQMYKSECRYLNNDLKRMSRSKRKDEKAIIKDSWKEGFGFLNRHKASGIYDDMKNISNTSK